MRSMDAGTDGWCARVRVRQSSSNIHIIVFLQSMITFLSYISNAWHSLSMRLYVDTCAL